MHRRDCAAVFHPGRHAALTKIYNVGQHGEFFSISNRFDAAGRDQCCSDRNVSIVVVDYAEQTNRHKDSPTAAAAAADVEINVEL